ncbi:MAG: L-glyceraldehyde 3-phosphate reductase [Planctomycetes bacterium]|nr:L-glyceraldehyde 3-phosphate reductase [Planctomycetota bacterium]
MGWAASDTRYDSMTYRRCGASGVDLPAVSLGIWHNFGEPDPYGTARAMIRTAFDAGICHIDAANNYGPPPGAAEQTLGRVLKQDLAGYRDELFISSKAGYRMWPGPYGDWGSRKYIVASCDQSLRRMGLDYVDLFYHHRPDPNTPLEETMAALAHLVASGKALYVGISSYDPDQTRQAVSLLNQRGVRCLIHQPSYSIFDRRIEKGLLQELSSEGVGCITFSCLAQGLLTDKYLNGIPADSRAAKPHGFLKPERITPELLNKVRRLNDVAQRRGQSLAQMAIAWVLRQDTVTSALIGASRPEQITEIVGALRNCQFSKEELKAIDEAFG